MRRIDARIPLVAALVAVFVAGYLFETRVLKPRRQDLLGRRSSPARGLFHAAGYSAARAAGEVPRFVPGEQRVALADLPTRAAAISLGGLRGFLAIYLWIDAETSKNKRRHEDLLDRYYRIADLQSDYTSVWDFHSWNLAWNISVQWSNVERRYEWIRHGIDFLREGLRRNPKSVDLLERMGYIYQQRIAENTRLTDREYFTARVEEDDGASPLRLAYMWYKQAREMQDETGESHSTFSKKILHQRPCYAAHEYAKYLTRKALVVLAEAADLRAAGRSGEARRRCRDGRDALAFAGRWWNKAVEEWARQRTDYPDDFNALVFGRGAAVCRGCADRLLAYVTPEQLERDAKGFRIRVASAAGFRPLVARNYYDVESPEAYHGP
jgi:hypothetical protein